MLCPTCHTFRPANNGPCPQCQAPSPLVGGQSGSDYTVPPAGNWGGPMTPGSSGQWDNAAYANAGQTNDNSLWAQVMAPQLTQEQGSGQHAQYTPGSALPVPYQPRQSPAMMPGFPNGIQLGGTGGLIPAQPAEDGPIYVPPMYTKPRAIIPRYRVISGLISFVIVIGLLCGGTVYYAKATGKLTFLRQLYNPSLPNVKLSPTALLPTPTTIQQYGPANNIISSAATASTIDPVTGYPKNATSTFVAGQKIYVTYSVHSTTAGAITIKWYTNGRDYSDSPSVPIAPEKNGINGNTAEIYSRACEGMVEIYWNNVLAVRIYFVVEPDPNATPTT